MSVRAGSSIRNDGGVVTSVSELFQHPQYNPSTIDYDISVLVLATPLTFSNAIGRIALPLLNDPLPVGEYPWRYNSVLTLLTNLLVGQYSVITGWGALTEGGSSANQLQAVRVPVVSLEECRAAYGESAITEFMMCAGYPEGGKDACQVN